MWEAERDTLPKHRAGRAEPLYKKLMEICAYVCLCKPVLDLCLHVCICVLVSVSGYIWVMNILLFNYFAINLICELSETHLYWCCSHVSYMNNEGFYRNVFINNDTITEQNGILQFGKKCMLTLSGHYFHNLNLN